MNLFELTQQEKCLMQIAENDEAIVEDEIFMDTWEALDGEIEEKADAYAKVRESILADIEALKNEEARMAKRRKALENNVAALMRALENALVSMGKKKFRTELFSFNIQKNPPKLVLDVDESAVPIEYKIPQPAKVDKTAIKEELKAGKELGFAHLEQTEGLRIR